MEKIVQNIPVILTVTPKEVANLFCTMDENEQAEFFNEVWDNVQGWGIPFEFQMEAINQSEVLHTGGRTIMQVIGNYSQIFNK